MTISPADEQLTIESDFKDEQHHEKDKQIESRVCEDEGGEYSHYGGCDTKGDEKKLDEIQEKVSKKLVEREQEEDESAQTEDESQSDFSQLEDDTNKIFGGALITTTPIVDDEGKRYENPDGGAPLYEDELTEDEKDYYEEYKPEKEQKQIEDYSNTVSELPDAPTENVKYSPVITYKEENEITPEEADEINEQNEQEEEEVADNNEDDNQVNTDTEDSSDGP